MNTVGKTGVKPKLRFPKFRNALGWADKSLGEALKFQAGFPFDSVSFTEECKGLRLIRNRDLRSDDKILFYSNSFDDRFVVNDGDVLIGMDGDFTPCIWNRGKALLNQRVGRIIPLKGNSQAFLYYFLTLHLKDIEEVTARTTVKHLSHSDVEKISEPIPGYPEQQKIADCLTSLDELIAAHGQKLDALKTHKKGLMQQLFPRTGETRPRLRFPEFQDAPEWQERTLEFACQMQAGKFVSASDIRDEAGEGLFPCYGGNGLRGYTRTFTHSGVFPLVGRQGALCGNIKLGSGQFHATEHAVVVTPRNGIDVNWLFYTLDLLNLNRFATGQAQPGLSVDVLEKVSLAIPENESEQKRIANCLSSLDEMISTQIQKLEALKMHKQGLMQQLFPSPEEVEA